MIALDTTLLVDSFTGQRPSYKALQGFAATGIAVYFPTLVLYEFLRGPRLQHEIDDLNEVLKPRFLLPFGPDEASLAASIYLSVSRARSRQIDIGIAACAILKNAALWTRNPRDFADIPGLKLYRLT